MVGGENMEEWERKSLMDELIQGRELAKQLQMDINSPSSSLETREPLVNRILESYEKALSMLNMSSGATTGEPSLGGGGGGGAAFCMSESPPPLGGSPVSDRDSRDASRKRKNVPQWTTKKQVPPGTGWEGALDDGYSWRKYGQKDILGAKHPRGYYRCTHQKLQGCLATKQVQKSDDDPNICEITYRGNHTCNLHQSSNITPLGSPRSAEDIEPTPNPPKAPTNLLQSPQENQQETQGIFVEFCRGLKVITEGFDSQLHPPPPFSFVSKSTTGTEPGVYSNPLQDGNIMGNFSPPYLSSAVSEAMNTFSGSASGISNYIVGQDFHGSELAEVVSAATSTMSSPTISFNFPIDKEEFDSNKKFNNPGFFP